MPWYYEENGAAAGPVESAQLVTLAESGRIRLETRVTSDHGQNWVPLAQVAHLVGLDVARLGVAAAPSAVPAATPAPAPAAVATRFRYGGFWIRFLARFVDGLLLIAVNLLFYLPFGLFAAVMGDAGALFGAAYCFTFLLQIAVGAAYEIVMTRKYGATLGKMMLRLKVVQPDGSPLSWERATGRYFATLLSSLTLLIGYIVAAFDAEKRALHDHVASTRVVFRA